MTFTRTFMANAEPLAVDTADQALMMGEEAFRAFYELTARGLWAYLSRTSGDSRLADDLLQEAYYRLLRSNAVFESDDHRRNYLFRIATNLVNDHRRKPFMEVPAVADDHAALAIDPHAADRAARRMDLHRAMAQLKPRERSLLWLAYAQGWSHAEIASAIGVKTASLKAMLHRARQRLINRLSVGGKS